MKHSLVCAKRSTASRDNPPVACHGPHSRKFSHSLLRDCFAFVCSSRLRWCMLRFSAAQIRKHRSALSVGTWWRPQKKNDVFPQSQLHGYDDIGPTTFVIGNATSSLFTMNQTDGRYKQRVELTFVRLYSFLDCLCFPSALDKSKWPQQDCDAFWIKSG